MGTVGPMLRTVALILAGSVVLSCAWQEAVPRAVHVRDFGVVGDGRADDGPAIRAAANVSITGNRILDSSGADQGTMGVKVTGSTGVRVE